MKTTFATITAVLGLTIANPPAAQAADSSQLLGIVLLAAQLLVHENPKQNDIVHVLSVRWNFVVYGGSSISGQCRNVNTTESEILSSLVDCVRAG